MGSYWIRHRLLFTVIFCLVLAAVTGMLFGYPYISQQAAVYNAQSIYKNTSIDFIAPEPSFEQVAELPGQFGIASVFPYFITDADLGINGKTKETTVLLSDQFQNVEITMYNSKRLIKKSGTEFENPILVDWKFCSENAANIGDTVTFYIGDDLQEYRIYAIYETNDAFDGALLAKIDQTQLETIVRQSDSHGYSAMFISASDYNACKTYLENDYRPLGRLRDRSEFSSDQSYQIHYDAIMSSDFANEVTDFRIKENSLENKGSSLLIWLGAALSAIAIVAFNLIMAKRGQEEAYFTKHCIPRGQNVKPYYTISFIAESLLSIGLFFAIIVIRKNASGEFIARTFGDAKVIIIPAAMIVAELVCLYLNNSKVQAASAEKRATIQIQENTYPKADATVNQASPDVHIQANTPSEISEQKDDGECAAHEIEERTETSTDSSEKKQSN